MDVRDPLTRTCEGPLTENLLLFRRPELPAPETAVHPVFGPFAQKGSQRIALHIPQDCQQMISSCSEGMRLYPATARLLFLVRASDNRVVFPSAQIDAAGDNTAASLLNVVAHGGLFSSPSR